jgi:hypothetical protein
MMAQIVKFKVSSIISISISWVVLGIFTMFFLALYLQDAGHPVNVVNDIVWWIEKVGIIAIALTLYGLWYQRRADNIKDKEKAIKETERRNHTCESLQREIRGHIDALTNLKYEKERYRTDDNTVNFTGRILKTDSYNSLIHSGLITNLGVEAQDELSSLYLRIKLRNDLIIYISRDASQITVQDPSSSEKLKKKSYLHFVEITKLELEIKDSLIGIEILIKKEVD